MFLALRFNFMLPDMIFKMVARHDESTISCATMQALGKTMDVASDRLPVSMQRWHRFLCHHHDDLRFVMIAMGRELKDEGANSVVQRGPTLTRGRIEEWRKQRQNVSLTYDMTDLTTAASLQRLFNACETNHSHIAASSFSDFLNTMATEFCSVNHGHFHIQSAFKLFCTMRMGEVVTITPPQLLLDPSAAPQFPA